MFNQRAIDYLESSIDAIEADTSITNEMERTNILQSYNRAIRLFESGSDWTIEALQEKVAWNSRRSPYLGGQNSVLEGAYFIAMLAINQTEEKLIA